MKYLKTKNCRRRGIAIELAIYVIMLCFGLSIVILTTTMIQKNNYNIIIREYTEKFELERIGSEFCIAVENKEIDYFKWKTGVETSYVIEVVENEVVSTLTIKNSDSSSLLLTVELTKVEEQYKITKWELE